MISMQTEIIIEETSSNHQVSLEYIKHQDMWLATWMNNSGFMRKMRYMGYSNVEDVKSMACADADKSFG